MKEMDYAIQCTDDRTGKKGTFGFTHARRLNTGEVRFYSLTPVFDSLVELFHYARDNNIDLSKKPTWLETGTNNLFEKGGAR